MNEVIDQAYELVKDTAAKFTTETYALLVASGTDKDDLKETGSMEEFCEDCIQAAIDKAHEKFFDDRLHELGKLHDVIMRGRHTYSAWSTPKGDHFGPRYAKTVKESRKVTPALIKSTERHISKKYPLKTVFGRIRYDTRNSSQDGFRYCEGGCGKGFDYSLELTEDEINHWMESPITLADLNNPAVCWELSEIFGYWELDEDYVFYNQIVTLAKSVVNASKQQPTV